MRNLIAKEMSAHLQKLQDQQNSAIQARTELLKGNLRMITAQRRERATLRRVQEKRCREETHARQTRYSKGLKGLLDFVTGKHRKTKEQNLQETKAATLCDEQEKDTLIFTHLEQRRTLGRRLNRLKIYEQNSAKRLTYDRSQYQDIERVKTNRNHDPSRGR